MMNSIKVLAVIAVIGLIGSQAMGAEGAFRFWTNAANDGNWNNINNWVSNNGSIPVGTDVMQTYCAASTLPTLTEWAAVQDTLVDYTGTYNVAAGNNTITVNSPVTFDRFRFDSEGAWQASGDSYFTLTGSTITTANGFRANGMATANNHPLVINNDLDETAAGYLYLEGNNITANGDNVSAAANWSPRGRWNNNALATHTINGSAAAAGNFYVHTGNNDVKVILGASDTVGAGDMAFAGINDGYIQLDADVVFETMGPSLGRIQGTFAQNAYISGTGSIECEILYISNAGFNLSIDTAIVYANRFYDGAAGGWYGHPEGTNDDVFLTSTNQMTGTNGGGVQVGIPEPATMGLMVLGGLAMLRRRK